MRYRLKVFLGVLLPIAATMAVGFGIPAMSQAGTDSAAVAPTPCTSSGCTLTVAIGGDGQGGVNSGDQPPTIICPASGAPTCSSTYPSGTKVSLTATAGPNSVFSFWGDGCTGTANPCSVTMDTNETVTAFFSSGSTPSPSPKPSPSPTTSPTTSPGTWETVACTASTKAKATTCLNQVKAKKIKGYTIEKDSSSSYEVRKKQPSKTAADKGAQSMKKAGFSKAHAEKEE